MMIQSTRFGEIEVADDALLELPDGLIGLPGRRYALVATSPESPFEWLHSTEHADLAVPVTSPWLFFSDYEVRVPDADARLLGLEGQVGTEILCVVRAAEELERFTVNLAAPIVVNAATRVARQIVNDAHGYSVAQALLSGDALAALTLEHTAA